MSMIRTIRRSILREYFGRTNCPKCMHGLHIDFKRKQGYCPHCGWNKKKR